MVPKGAPVAAAAPVAFILGLLPAYFVALDTVTGDTGEFGDRVLADLYVLVVYLVLGGLFGLIVRNLPWLSAALLALPAFAVLIWRIATEPSQTLIALGVMLLAAAGAFLGAWAGWAMRRPHARTYNPDPGPRPVHRPPPQSVRLQSGRGAHTTHPQAQRGPPPRSQSAPPQPRGPPVRADPRW